MQQVVVTLDYAASGGNFWVIMQQVVVTSGLLCSEWW
jgi:hypothetical protein